MQSRREREIIMAGTQYGPLPVARAFRSYVCCCGLLGGVVAFVFAGTFAFAGPGRLGVLCSALLFG